MPIFSIIFLFILIWIFVRYTTSKKRFLALFSLTVVLQTYYFQGYFIQIGAQGISSCEGMSLKLLVLYSLWLLFSGKVRPKRNVYVGAMFCFMFLFGSILYETFVPFDGLLLPHMGEDTDGTMYGWDALVAGTATMVSYQPPLQELVRKSTYFFYYVFILVAFKEVFDFESFTRTLMSIVKWGKLCIYYGLFEFFLKNIMGQLTFTYDLAQVLFGVNGMAVQTVAYSKGGNWYTLQGFTSEPAHFVIYLFTVAFFMILAGVCQKRCLELGIYVKRTFYPFEIFLSVLLMFLCGGFSAVWMSSLLLVVSIIVYIRSRHISLWHWIRKYQLAVLGVVVIGMALGFVILNNDYYVGRLQDMLYILAFLQPGNLDITGMLGVVGAGGNEGIHSTVARLGSIAYGIEICLERPLFGIGPGTLWVFDTIITLWLYYGILALLAVYYLLTRSRFGLRYDHFLLFTLIVIGGFPMNLNVQNLSLSYIVFAEASAIYLLRVESISKQEKEMLMGESPDKT